MVVVCLAVMGIYLRHLYQPRIRRAHAGANSSPQACEHSTTAEAATKVSRLAGRCRHIHGTFG